MMRLSRSWCRQTALLLFLWGGPSPASGVELDARVKVFGTGAALIDTDAQRLQDGTPAYDYTHN